MSKKHRSTGQLLRRAKNNAQKIAKINANTAAHNAKLYQFYHAERSAKEQELMEWEDIKNEMRDKGYMQISSASGRGVGHRDIRDLWGRIFYGRVINGWGEHRRNLCIKYHALRFDKNMYTSQLSQPQNVCIRDDF